MHMMQISPEQGQFMSLLVKLIGVERAIEVGVYTGYSSLCVAMAIPPQGEMIACDVSETWTSVPAVIGKKPALPQKSISIWRPLSKRWTASLNSKEEWGAYDFVFIDADKENYDGYYERCLKLLRSGGLMAIDNVFWGGRVANPEISDTETTAIRALNEKIHADDRVDMSMMPIGDGLMLVRKR